MTAATWMGAAFPAVVRWLGPMAFAAVAGRFLARPEGERCQADAFPSFLAVDGAADQLPFLPDLARLEGALAAARLLPAPRPVTWAEMTRLGPEGLARLRLRLRPDAVLLRSPWPLCLLRASSAPAGAAAEARTVLALRDGDELRCQPLDEEEAGLLGRLAAGATLMEMQAGLAGEDRASLVRLLGRFRAVVERGLVVAAPPSAPEE